VRKGEGGKESKEREVERVRKERGREVQRLRRGE
jgi:hypothetical protein